MSSQTNEFPILLSKSDILEKNNNEITLNALIQNLVIEGIEGLPPGAGIEAK